MTKPDMTPGDTFTPPPPDREWTARELQNLIDRLPAPHAKMDRPIRPSIATLIWCGDVWEIEGYGRRVGWFRWGRDDSAVRGSDVRVEFATRPHLRRLEVELFGLWLYIHIPRLMTPRQIIERRIDFVMRTLAAQERNARRRAADAAAKQEGEG